jgi:transcriptional regulator with XRE-family HTH domain
MTFGELLKQLREDRNLSQQELAEKAGVSRGTISALEINRVSPTDAGFGAVIGVARALEINPLVFLVEAGLVTEEESLILQAGTTSEDTEAELIKYRTERLSESDKKLVLELLDSLGKKSRFKTGINFKTGKFKKK